MAGSPNFPRLRGGDPQQTRVQDNIGAQVSSVAKAVAATPMLNGTLPAWVWYSLTGGFANNTNVGTGGTVTAPASRHRDSLGYFHLQGALTHAAGCAAGTVLAVAPMGERPKYEQRIPVKGTGGTFQCILVSPNGNISVEVAVAAGGSVDLCGSYLADG